MAAKYVLGVTTLQMNKDHDYGGATLNQLAVLERLGVFKAKLPQLPERLPRLVDYQNMQEDLNLRSRAYLHANCAHCHRKWGGGNADFDLQASIALSATRAVNTPPGQGSLGLPDPRILVPGAPERSLVIERMKLEGLGRMPHVASTVVDHEALAMLRAWIIGLSEGNRIQNRGAINPRVVDGE
jgi:hypothetical protein